MPFMHVHVLSARAQPGSNFAEDIKRQVGQVGAGATGSLWPIMRVHTDFDRAMEAVKADKFAEILFLDDAESFVIRRNNGKRANPFADMAASMRVGLCIRQHTNRPWVGLAPELKTYEVVLQSYGVLMREDRHDLAAFIAARWRSNQTKPG